MMLVLSWQEQVMRHLRHVIVLALQQTGWPTVSFSLRHIFSGFLFCLNKTAFIQCYLKRADFCTLRTTNQLQYCRPRQVETKKFKKIKNHTHHCNASGCSIWHLLEKIAFGGCQISAALLQSVSHSNILLCPIYKNFNNVRRPSSTRHHSNNSVFPLK